VAGIDTGVVTMIPAVLEQAVPNYWMISDYASPLLLSVFVVALLQS
jgi:hypothetical protein